MISYQLDLELWRLTSNEGGPGLCLSSPVPLILQFSVSDNPYTMNVGSN